MAAQRETKYCTMLSRLPDHGIVVNFHIFYMGFWEGAGRGLGAKIKLLE